MDVKAEMTKYFIDRPAVMSAVDKGKRTALMKIGGWIRLTARRSIRPARRMKADELPPERREAFEKAVSIAKQKGEPKPKLPKAPSEPGEPPRSRTGLLKRLLFFGYEPGRSAVLVGPARISKKGEAPAVLEFGGEGEVGSKKVQVEPRPYMGPAFEKAQQAGVLTEAWANSVRK